MPQRISSILVLLVTLLAAANSHADDPPAFLIESISVSGLRYASERHVISQSRLREGRTYDESSLRNALARIERLPFVLSADFRLEKGSSPGRYVLQVAVRETKPLFISANALGLWKERQPSSFTQDRHLDFGTDDSDLTVGGRWFLGSNGMIHAAAILENENRYSLGYMQNDLFGTGAVLAFAATYQENAILSVRGANVRDWSRQNNVAYEVIGVLPLGLRHSLRAEWQWGSYPTESRDVVPDQGRFLRPGDLDRQEISWIYDTTDDLYFPSSGSRITAGLTRAELPETTGFPIRSFKDMSASMERSWSLSPRQAITGGAAWSARTNDTLKQYRAHGRYSADLWGGEKNLERGDLRFEAEIGRTIQILPVRDSYSSAGLGVAFRNEWGIVRFNLEYTGDPRP